MTTLTLAPKASLPNTGNWKERHLAAIHNPQTPAAVNLLSLMPTAAYWANVAESDSYAERHVLLPLLSSMRAMLDYDLGDLDVRTLDEYLRALAEQAGIDPDSI